MTWTSLKRILSFAKRRISSNNAGDASARDWRKNNINAAAKSARHRFLSSFSAVEPEVDDARSDVVNNEELDALSTASVTSSLEMEESDAKGPVSSTPEELLRPYISNTKEIDKVESGHFLPTRSRTIIKEPFTRDLITMDHMLDAVLTMRNPVPTEDTSDNAEAVIKAIAAGVKVRDFAAPVRRLAPRELAANLFSAASKPRNGAAIELFDAHRKALAFFYLRFLVNAGIYDLPQYDFTVDDVDRLFTCGILGIEDFDNTVVASMLAHGTFRRLARSFGFEQVDGTILPPRGPWTILGDYRRPTQEEIEDYIASRERARFSQRYAIWPYRLAAFERPIMSFEYIRFRLRTHGFWGLRYMGNISDSEADGMFDLKDDSFIRPEKPLVKEKERPPLEGQDTELLLDPSEPGESISQTTAKEAAPVDRPASPSISVQEANPSTPRRGRSTGSEGKKRARSTSVSCERHNDGSVRQTRRRLSGTEPSPSTLPNVSMHSSPPAPADPTQVSPKRDKRMRDDDGDNEILNEASPTKKMRMIRETSSASSSDVETRTVVDAESSVLADGAVPCTSETVSSPTASSGLLRMEPSLQLAASPASNSTPATPPQRKHLTRLQPLVVDPAPSDGDSGLSLSALATDYQTSVASGSSDIPSSGVRRSNASAVSSVTVNGAVAPLNGRSTYPSLPITARRGRSILVDPNTGNIGALTRSGFVLANHLRVEVPPNTEKSPSYALLGEGLVIPSWSELCRTRRVPGPYERAHSRALLEREDAGMSSESGSEDTIRPRRPLTRQYTCYLDEVFPQFHPPRHGRKLTRNAKRFFG